MDKSQILCDLVDIMETPIEVVEKPIKTAEPVETKEDTKECNGCHKHILKSLYRMNKTKKGLRIAPRCTECYRKQYKLNYKLRTQKKKNNNV